MELADEETSVDPPPTLAWWPAVEEWVLRAAEEEGVRTFVVRSGIAHGRGTSVTVRELVVTARERGTARHVVPPRARTMCGRSCISKISGISTPGC